MQPKTKKRLKIVLLVIGIALAVPVWFAYRIGVVPRLDRIQTFHAPVFGREGRDIYFIERRAWGISWGIGAEFFTPPAHIVDLSDRFLLKAIDIQSGQERTLHEWRVPVLLTPREQYRNYLFGIPDCELTFEGNQLSFKIGLDFEPNEPPYFTVREWTTGSWNGETGSVSENEHWKKAYYSVNPWNEQVLSGPFEAINYKNLAIVLYNSGTGERKALLVSGTAERGLSEEILSFDPAVYTHRAGLERSRTIRETYAGLTRQFENQGMPEGSAMLRANDEMEKLGYYPRSPKLVASKIQGPENGVEVFTITDDEFRFGLFQDIEKAIANIGEEVHFSGSYIRHRDFVTSEKLNSYLAAGNTRFIVKTGTGEYLLTVRK